MYWRHRDPSGELLSIRLPGGLSRPPFFSSVLRLKGAIREEFVGPQKRSYIDRQQSGFSGCRAHCALGPLYLIHSRPGW